MEQEPTPEHELEAVSAFSESEVREEATPAAAEEAHEAANEEKLVQKPTPEPELDAASASSENEVEKEEEGTPAVAEKESAN